MDRHTIGDLHQMQSLPLEVKIRMTQRRICEWVERYGMDGVYIAFSGGKDSTVLLHMARQLYPEIPAVYVDTGLEYPEVKAFVKQHENVEILRPKKDFRQVIEQYGYPFISKEVAGCVWGARRYVEKLMEWEREKDGGGIIANYSCMADLLGIDRREDKENDAYRDLRYGKVPGMDGKVPVRYLILQGKYPHKEKGKETAEYSKIYNKERYRFFLGAPFEISDRCCGIMKKEPLHSYAKRTGRMPVTAQMASESRLRTVNWMKNGCNGFDMKRPISNPMAFWTEQDVLEYISHNRIPIASVYGKVQAEERKAGKHGKRGGKEVLSAKRLESGLFDAGKPVYATTGCRRTGCVFCGFGCHREKTPNRWETAERYSNPAVIDYMLRGGRFDERGIWRPDHRGLGFWFVIEWINVYGNLKIIMPHREEYVGRYMTGETERKLAV